MKTLLIIIILPFTILSQNQNTFRIEFNTDFRGYEMEEFNERINDPAYIDPFIYDELPSISLTEGFNFGMSVSYRPFKFVSFGVYGGYQFGKVDRDLRIILNEYDIYTPNDTFPGKRMFEVQSINVGLNTSLIFNQMSFWKSEAGLKNVECVISLKTGYGRAYLFQNDVFEGTIQDDSKSVYSSKGLQFVSTVQLGYILTNSNYFSSIGIEAGYQYFKTSDLQSEGGAYYPSERKTKLDFSGFNVGVYLSIGR